MENHQAAKTACQPSSTDENGVTQNIATAAAQMTAPSRRPHLLDRLFFLLTALHALIRQRNWGELAFKAFRLWKASGITGIWKRLWKIGRETLGYARWVKQFDTLDDIDRRAILDHISRFRNRSLISVLMPTCNSPERWLRHAIESVRNQLYPNWELCIADDASSQPHVRTILKEYQRLDDRIKVVFRDCNGHISAATNSALQLATGEFVALLDHDDELPEHALYMVALAIEDSPGLNLLYSDEDKIDEHGRRFGPYFKPDWNPDLLNAQNMISHLGVYRTDTLISVGGFRKGVEGAQDWDVALRLAEQIPQSTILHIPHVLYHWRAISGSTAIGPEEKSYVATACQRVVREHLQRINQSASVEPAFSSFVRVRYPLPAPIPLVSIVLLGDSGNSGELIRRTRYPALEIIPHTSSSGESPAEAINRAARQAHGDLLCFLDAKLPPETEDWLEELVGHAWRPEIGAVGPMQLDVDGNIRRALTVLCNGPEGNGVSRSFYQGSHRQEKGVTGRAALQQNVSVLAPGCLLLRAEAFWTVNGMDAHKFPNTLFELDLCLRLIQAGYRNVWNPHSRMVWADRPKRSDVCDQSEAEIFRMRWQGFLCHDPTHNPNLACDSEWPLLAFPPRIDYPWRQ